MDGQVQADRGGEVLERLRSGDAEAMTVVMRQHNHALWRIARGILSSESEAEDAVQDAYISAFTHLEDFRGQSSLYTWLARITINEALRRLRRQRPILPLDALAHTPVDHPHSTVPTASFNPEHTAARREIARMIEQAIDGLTPSFRTVFVMRVIEQMSIEETSQRLGIPPDTVKTRLHRANQQLRRKLGAQFADVFTGIFPFGGARCERLQRTVLARLGLATPSSSGTTALFS
jgi:RNA polymerase sigma-70 factor (ECF subfamily)